MTEPALRTRKDASPKLLESFTKINIVSNPGAKSTPKKSQGLNGFPVTGVGSVDGRAVEEMSENGGVPGPFPKARGGSGFSGSGGDELSMRCSFIPG